MRSAIKGQFSIIAAALLAIILISAVAVTYSIINFSLPKEQTNVSSSVYEINNALKQMLEFAVGYYCSVLQVTGNSSFAQSLARNYLSSGFEFIANSHPELNPSIRISGMNFSVRWYEASSYSMGYLKSSYDLLSLRLSNINYEAFCALRVEIVDVRNETATVNVTIDESRPYSGLSAENFLFYYYDNATSSWMKQQASSFRSENNLYLLGIPQKVDKKCFLMEVSDPRGIITINFYSTRKKPQITYTFDWNATGMQSIYTQLKNDKIVVEVLQNGTLLWLGQKLLDGYPIPQLPIKCLRISANADPNHLEAKQIPFQVEDWASNYKVPLGRSSGETLFSDRNMIVFLADHNIKNVTIWWDGRDNAQQTPYATLRNFNDKVEKISSNRAKLVLNNNVILVNITYGGGVFYVETATSRANFMRINGHFANFYASPSFPIINGTVRDVIQQEAEWSNYDNWGFPNTYAQIVLTFPANATYYTYALRLIFVNASTCPEDRTIRDLTPLMVSSEWKSSLKVLTENGTSSGIPIAVETYVGGYAFYNFSDGQWQHHWTQYNFTSSAGAGVMFTTLDNMKLYFFDKIAGSNTGILNVTTIKRLMSPNSVYDRCGYSGDNTATRSIDGDVSTYWRHNAQCYHWIIYDLGSSMNVSRIRIYQPSGSTYDWGGTAGIEVYVSNNPSNWGSAVWSGSVAGDGWVYTGVFQAQGRYVRLVSKSNSADQRLYEVQVEVQQFQSTIEVSPIKLRPASFKYPLDIMWFGAVVAIQSGTDFIYKNGVGLWVVVEHPPKVEVIA